MHITIENPLHKTFTYGAAVNELGSICQVIAQVGDETELRREFSTRTYVNLQFGFGGHHMWIKQVDLNNPGHRTFDERIAIVRF